MKPVVACVIAFVVTTAASTGAKVAMTVPGSAVHAADSTKADSLKKLKDSTGTDTAIVASGEPSKPPTDSAHRAAVGSDSTKAGAVAKPGPAGPIGNDPIQALAARAAAAAAEAALPDTSKQTSERRLAKVFTSMDPKQAAKVLEHMTDSDVKIILGYVGPRQAASIMTALPPDRVATLSKLAMQGKK